MLPAEELSSAATEARERITKLVAEHSEPAETRVPACPEWAVKDVIAHLAGVCGDILAGNLDGVTTDPWTAAQVAARKSLSLDELLEQWARDASQVEPLVPMFPGRYAQQWLADIATHEHDLRGALEMPGARDSTATRVAIDFMIGWFVRHSVADKPVAVVAGDQSWGEPASDGITILRGDAFELMRAVTGRRSLTQIRDLDWSDDPEPFLPLFEWGPFRPAATDIVE
jgi:uncharacterized protein (TIGR03083 family)